MSALIPVQTNIGALSAWASFDTLLQRLNITEALLKNKNGQKYRPRKLGFKLRLSPFKHQLIPTIGLMNIIRIELGNEFGERQGKATFNSKFRSIHKYHPMKQGFLKLYENGFDPTDKEAIFYDIRSTRR